MTGMDNCIRKVDPYGINLVTTFAGKQEQAGWLDDESHRSMFNCPGQIACYGANILYVADASNHAIRAIYTEPSRGFQLAKTVVGTVAGVGESKGLSDGPILSLPKPQFNNPTGVAVDENGRIFVADCENGRIRLVTPGAGRVTTFAGRGTGKTFRNKLTDGDLTTAGLYQPRRLLLDGCSHALYFTQAHSLSS